MKIFVAFLFIAILFTFIHGKSFSNYKVLQFDFKSETELKNFLKEFPEDQLDVFSGDGSLSFKTPNDIFFTPKQFQKLKTLKSISYKILVEDYQKIIEQEKEEMKEFEDKMNRKNITGLKNQLNFRLQNENWFRYFSLLFHLSVLITIMNKIWLMC
jgi:hypothetical protein